MKKFFKINAVGLVVGLLVFIVLLGTGSLLAYRVYVVRDGSALVRAVGGWLPVVKVGGHKIRYSEFLETRETLRIYLSSDAAVQAGVAREMSPEVERQGLERLVRERLTQDLAAERNVSVPDEDVTGSFAAMVAMNSSTIPDVNKYLQENYKWNEKDFQENVIRPAILEERVAETFSTSTQEQFAMMEAWMYDRLSKPDIKYYLKFEEGPIVE